MKLLLIHTSAKVMAIEDSRTIKKSIKTILQSWNVLNGPHVNMSNDSSIIGEQHTYISYNIVALSLYLLIINWINFGLKKEIESNQTFEQFWRST